MRPTIAIVDDDESVRESTTDLLQAMGYLTEAFERADDFLKSQHLQHTSCLIADVCMPGMTGLDLYNRLVSSGKRIPTILITAFPNDRDQTRALRAGVICYLTKPFTQDNLVACIRTALERRHVD